MPQRLTHVQKLLGNQFADSLNHTQVTSSKDSVAELYKYLPCYFRKKHKQLSPCLLQFLLKDFNQYGFHRCRQWRVTLLVLCLCCMLLLNEWSSFAAQICILLLNPLCASP